MLLDRSILLIQRIGPEVTNELGTIVLDIRSGDFLLWINSNKIDFRTNLDISLANFHFILKPLSNGRLLHGPVAVTAMDP